MHPHSFVLQDAATAHLLAELEAEEAAAERKAGEKAKRRKSKAAARRRAVDSASEVSPPELLPAGVRIDEVNAPAPLKITAQGHERVAEDRCCVAIRLHHVGHSRPAVERGRPL